MIVLTYSRHVDGTPCFYSTWERIPDIVRVIGNHPNVRATMCIMIQILILTRKLGHGKAVGFRPLYKI